MSTSVKKIILAPMEGVVDALMRDLLTQINHFDLCITEFIRVVDRLVPEHVYYRHCPELYQSGFTPAKTPIRVQLLGQDPSWMAENAVRALALGSHGVDLNFGCPAQTVNKSKGGAVLLKSPEVIYQICHQVKQAINTDEQLSVKIRLGFDDSDLLTEIVDAIVQSGANLLTIHARTKRQGYKPPAYWQSIAQISKKFTIDLVANGEIWQREDAINCMQQAQTNNIMLGRGILALPNLAQVIRYDDAPMTWLQQCQLLHKYSQMELQSAKGFYFSSRLKQWLKYLKCYYPEAEHLFENIKRLSDKNEILALIN